MLVVRKSCLEQVQGAYNFCQVVWPQPHSCNLPMISSITRTLPLCRHRGVHQIVAMRGLPCTQLYCWHSRIYSLWWFVCSCVGVYGHLVAAWTLLPSQNYWHQPRRAVMLVTMMHLLCLVHLRAPSPTPCICCSISDVSLRLLAAVRVYARCLSWLLQGLLRVLLWAMLARPVTVPVC